MYRPEALPRRTAAPPQTTVQRTCQRLAVPPVGSRPSTAVQRRAACCDPAPSYPPSHTTPCYCQVPPLLHLPALGPAACGSRGSAAPTRSPQKSPPPHLQEERRAALQLVW